MHALKRARLRSAKRGPKGGYQLTRHPATITLGDVLRALEAVPARRARPKLPRDPVDAVLLDLERRVDECFDAFSLADVCRRAELPQRALGDRRLESEGPEYAI